MKIQKSIDFIKNNTVFKNKYKTNSEAIIISCFFNPQLSSYRLKAFNIFYESIKHLNHSIIECIIGDNKPQLPENENIKRIYTESLLWHKEALLNKIVSELPEKYKYIFWIDADVIFTNLNWLTDGVKELQSHNIIQPFNLCVHLERDEISPSFVVDDYRYRFQPNAFNHKVWLSFCSNFKNRNFHNSEDYNKHGHVGFAWGARREILEQVPLYDKALIGGADHIIAHAAAGQIPHNCITKSFTDNIEEVNEWSNIFHQVVKEKISYVPGNLYHIWHGDIDKRQYLKRIKDFTSMSKNIHFRDKNGLYIARKTDETHMKKYFREREVSSLDDGFLNSMLLGYMTDSTLIGTAIGGNMAGAMIGDMLNQSDNNLSFGEGNGGGSGATGDFQDNQNFS